MNKIKYYLNKKITNPAYKLILTTINHNRILIIINFNANILASAFEGSTFGLIFLALSVLEKERRLNILENPIVKNTFLINIFENLSRGQLFISLIILAILAQIIKNILTYIGAVSSDYLGAKIRVEMTETLFRKIMSFTFPCASRYKVGDLTSYVVQAGGTVTTEVSLYNNLIINCFTTIAYAIVLFSISVPLSGITVVISVLLIVIQKYLLPRIKQNAIRIIKAEVELSKQMVESIQALRVIHTFGREKAAIQELHQLQQDLLPEIELKSRLTQIMGPLGQAITIITVAILLICGFLFLKDSAQVLPSLVTFILALNRLSAQLNSFIKGFNQLAQNSGNIIRLEEILNPEDKEFISQNGQEFSGLNTAIKFNQIYLQYPETENLALTNLSFELKKGTVTALVGGSGAGKSSIADLLIGLYQPTSGSILLDDINLEEYNPSTWRSHLGVVSQDTFIFNQTIFDNIRYGKPEATQEEVMEAAQASQAHKFIMELPEGYQTIVGERGYRLSGGQRQRLALARAILKHPDVLILDEATSALDSQSERLVQEALVMFQKQRTVLVIAHRLSTIIDADQIIVLEQGQVKEKGNHQELLTKEGFYAKYWGLQSQYS